MADDLAISEYEDEVAATNATSVDDAVLLKRLRAWFRKDRDHGAKWREEAQEDYAFVAGDQWNDADIRVLKENLRPIITFNRIDPVIRSVAGEQINNAQEVRYMPREPGDAKANEVLTSAAGWFRDLCDADDEESDGFWDAAVCGVGVTDTRLDMDENPDEPAPVVERVDPLEMLWDCDARKRNFADARRIWRVRDMPIDAAKLLFPDATESDLNASWAAIDISTGDIRDQTTDDQYQADQNNQPLGSIEKTVTIVQCQWWEMEEFYKILDPISGQAASFSVDSYERIAGRMKQLGMNLQAVKLEKRVYKQAFIGRTFLKPVAELECPAFTFNFITGFRDRNKGHFYGMVRAMKDPQRWANKWLSQTLHIMNSSAKGGVLAERGISDDQKQFEESYAKNDQVTWLEAGTIANNRIRDKPTAQFPAGFYQLMTFAISSVRDVSGINLEMLGMREADQPASLEYQRRQAGITILAQLFRSMRRYHRNQGKVMLYYIQHYLSDGRLVRIVGQDGAKYVPLVRQADIQYDIVVDEGPTSPNQKERVWALIGDRFWGLPPQIQLALLEYSPFPESVVEKIKAAANQASQGPQAQMAQQMAQLQAMLLEAKTLLTRAQAGKAQAETAKVASEVGQVPQAGGMDPMEHQHRMAELQAKTATDRLSIATRAEVDLRKAQEAAAVQRERTAADVMTNREWMVTEATTDLQKERIKAVSRPNPGPRRDRVSHPSQGQ